VVAAAATICSLEEVTALQAADLHQLFVDLSIDMVRITNFVLLLLKSEFF
jgi:hypothetical protein